MPNEMCGRSETAFLLIPFLPRWTWVRTTSVVNSVRTGGVPSSSRKAWNPSLPFFHSSFRNQRSINKSLLYLECELKF